MTGRAAVVDETALTDPLLDPAFYAGDPYPLYARLRAEAPVARNDTLGLWMVSRHAEVVAVSRDPETFCSSKGIMTFEIGARVPDAADHDAHRSARPHPLPDAGPARVPPDATCGRWSRASAGGPARWSTASSPGCPSTSWPTWPSRCPCR